MRFVSVLINTAMIVVSAIDNIFHFNSKVYKAENNHTMSKYAQQLAQLALDLSVVSFEEIEKVLLCSCLALF